jgi:hypothetical protein
MVGTYERTDQISKNDRKLRARFFTLENNYKYGKEEYSGVRLELGYQWEVMEYMQHIQLAIGGV